MEISRQHTKSVGIFRKIRHSGSGNEHHPGLHQRDHRPPGSPTVGIALSWRDAAAHEASTQRMALHSGAQNPWDWSPPRILRPLGQTARRLGARRGRERGVSERGVSERGCSSGLPPAIHPRVQCQASTRLSVAELFPRLPSGDAWPRVLVPRHAAGRSLREWREPPTLAGDCLPATDPVVGPRRIRPEP